MFLQYSAVGEVASGTCSEVTCASEVLSTMERYLYVDCQWFGQFLSNELEAVKDHYITRLETGKDACGSTILLS